MSDKATNHTDYMGLLLQRVVVFDGAMGTNLERPGLAEGQVNGCNDLFNLTHPRAVESVHRGFLQAGVDVIETNTFRSNRFTLAEFGLENQVHEINLAGARLAHRCADAFSSKQKKRFVAGSIGPTGKLLSLDTSTGEQACFEAIRYAIREQARALIEGGVDLLLLETMQDMLEVKAAVHGIHAALEDTGITLPIQVQVTLDVSGRMLPGSDISAACAALSGLQIDVFGINCSTGPEAMRPALEVLARECPLPLSCLPNAGMPVNRDGQAIYPLQPQDFASRIVAFVREFGLSVVGGCCGTTPEHLRLLMDRLRDTVSPPRKVIPAPRLASTFHSLELHQQPPTLIIGERLNTQGSRVFKELMLHSDYPAALRIAREQIASGAHALDVCVALTEDGDEAKRMKALVTLLARQVDAPLVIDSTDPDVMECALTAYPGRCLLNSIHLEGGEDKARRVLALAKAHNAAVIALTIDENGMARSAQKKLRVAQRIRALAVNEMGLPEDALVFDPLTFTLASGSHETLDAGNETLRAIQLIKENIPKASTCLGVSNISYGLSKPARAVLNSVFLYHAVQEGLDMAILNPAQITPYPSIAEHERRLAEDLLFNRSPDALEKFTAAFSGDETPTYQKWISTIHLPLEERIRQRILLREPDGITDDLEMFIHGDTTGSPSSSALRLLNTVLLPAMKEVGDQFRRGELILPFVLQSAEIMRAATRYLEQYLSRSNQAHRGRVVLATVYGDVHDIGKNLVHSILANNGYEVIDLGKQVPAEEIVTRALESGADAVGLSALLVSTSQQMRLVVQALAREGARIPVLIGGAAVNTPFAAQIAEVQSSKPYAGGVHYCADAFDALKVLDARGGHHPTRTDTGTSQKSAPMEDPAKSSAAQPDLQPAKVPHPPFLGSQLIRDIPMEELFGYINHPALFRISWGAGKARGEKWDKLRGEFEEMLAEMGAQLLENHWLEPQIAFGFYPCQSDLEESCLIIFDPQRPKSEIVRLDLPRQTGGERLSLLDYFAPVASGMTDLAAFQMVSMGQRAVSYVRALQEAGEITQAYFAHGLAVQLTEAAAAWTQARIRSELGLPAHQGKRYSWGFPAIPDLSQHRLLFRLLPAESMGISLTSAFQFVPEYTTSALIVHHPQARYFQMD